MKLTVAVIIGRSIRNQNLEVIMVKTYDKLNENSVPSLNNCLWD